MFKELDTNLKAINDEVSKLQSAVENINQAKSAAQKAVEVADKLQENFGAHLVEVKQNVDNVLKPHIELVKVTIELTEAIKDVNFPERLDKQEKEIKFLKMILFIICGLIVIGTVATIFALK